MGTGFIHLAAPIFCLLLCFQIGSAGWGKWSAWTACSVTCGNGIQTRIRHCTVGPKETLKCVFANQTEEYQCYAGESCPPIDGGWTAWLPWSNCTRKCGVGSHERFRHCTNPRPQYGGKVCEGVTQEIASCINPACPPLYQGEVLTDCPEGRVHCADGRQCIAEYRRCDFWIDCHDSSDESACREGEPVLIFYNNNSGNSLTMRSLTFPIISSGFAMWFSNYIR